ncbi:MAG: hypothetical protein AB8V06_06020 [Francisella endosymbiont of Hyalomma asiaticum]
MQKFIKDIKFKDIKNIQINRILTFISLPFDVSNLDKKPIKESEIFYAIYRNTNHKTSYQKIPNLEFVTISLAVEKGE